MRSEPRLPLSRLAPIAMALVVVLPGCLSLARHGATVPSTSITPQTYGSGQSLPPLNPNEALKNARGRLRVQVLDDRNRPLPGAYIRYKGPDTGRAATDKNGIIDVTIHAGTYKVDVAPCGSTVVTKSYAEAGVTVGRDQTAQGQLTQIKWERRFQPSPSVVESSPPPWKVGKRIDIGVRIEDRCTFAAAPGASLAAYAWKSSGNFGFTAQPVMRADAQGFARIRIACLHRGDGSVTIYDPSVPGSGIDVIMSGQGPGSGHHDCE